MSKYELYNKKMHLTFIPLRSIKAGDFAVRWPVVEIHDRRKRWKTNPTHKQM